MVSKTPSVDQKRREMLREMLVRTRDETYQRIREIRAEQEQESDIAPGDEMDAARAAADVETHAGLIANAELRLKDLDDALARLEEGRYGVCTDCNQPIPVERLIAVPFALYCVKCEAKRPAERIRPSEGGTIPPYDQQWSPPEEMEEPGERQYRPAGADEDLTTHYETPFGPEEPVLPKPGKRKPARSPDRRSR